jgi:hypothetical protein
MKRIGYWIESLRDTVNLPPQELVRAMDDDVRRTLSDYLDSGEVHQTYRGTSWCRFFCGHQMGCRDFSDGEWIWPEDLGHYVREHSVALPPEFVEHVLADTPAIGRERGTGHGDGDLWQAWCLQNASEQYRHRLEQARAQADVHAQRSIAAAIARHEAQDGVSAQPCMWAGCGNRALSGRSICAACWVRTEEEEMITLHAHSYLWPFLEFYPATAKRPLEQVIFDVAEYQRDEDYNVLYRLLRDTEMHLSVEVPAAPAPSKWGLGFMKRIAPEPPPRLVQGPTGAVVVAVTPSVREGASGNFHAMEWMDLLKRVLSVPGAQGLIVQGTTSWMQFDMQRIRYILTLQEQPR